MDKKKKPVKKKPIKRLAEQRQSYATSIEKRLSEAVEKAEKKSKLSKPITEMSEQEILFLDKQLQATLSPQEKGYIGTIRRAKILDYLLKVELGELVMKKGEIAKAVNISSAAFSVYINDPLFQEEYKNKCKELQNIMKNERVSACRRIATSGLSELESRMRGEKITKLGVSTLMDVVTFAIDLEMKESGTDIKTTKVIHEGEVTNTINVKEEIKDKEFRAGLKDLIKKRVTEPVNDTIQ